jgi:hypothetical protein
LLSHCKFRGDDLEFDNDHEFSVTAFTNNEGVEIKSVGVRMLHEDEEEEGDDDDDVQIILIMKAFLKTLII